MAVVRKNNIHIIGNPEAPQTLVFGHGFGIDQTSFREVVTAFADDYKIVLYDNVGGGQSDLAAFSFNRYATTDGYVKDVADIIRELGLTNVTFVGHSVSGMIGLLTSLQYPGIFERLIMIGSSPRYLNDEVKDYIGGFNQQSLDDLYAAMEANYHAWASGFSALAMNQPNRPELAAGFAESLIAIRADIAIAVARSIFQLDHREALQHVNIPVLILQTADDIAVPGAVSEYMEARIPDSKRIKVHTTGHFPHMSAPQEVVSAIKTFL
ncbi:alpha/beta fold hydrolase [Chitinophaga sp. sic0106]|uniref:alpha/beta fold hydrolase n=1 Tax=Chitinophaga sp. sic0106 TaxID=2854785 RepID=UPI001C48945B|nr:alpha/beta hydrolase [Chitinophaga sp. sic0106]MBV7531462.1 alpha/beta hydrolase [Chitinophaga sp. sic0106]